MDPFVEGVSYEVAMNPNDGLPTQPTMFKLQLIHLSTLTTGLRESSYRSVIPLIHPTVKP
jgi:hypothetical protein